MAPKYTLERIQAIAAERGGECLTDECRGVKAKYRWRCADGHEWDARLDNIVHGNNWCRICSLAANAPARIANNLRSARELAASKGGECLATENFSVRVLVDWRCASGHEWRANFHNMRHQGSWCPTCANERRGITPRGIEDAHAIALDRGGKCLSTQYVNNTEHLEWECASGHTWEATYHNVADKGSWCPSCKLVSENLCDEVLRVMFPNHEFERHKRRLPWLLDRQGQKRSELDFWCKDLRLAIECQGRQHVQVVEFFHRRGEADLQDQIERDTRKKEQCEREGVCLIELPHTLFEGRSLYRYRRRAIARYLSQKVGDLGYPEGTHLSGNELVGCF